MSIQTNFMVCTEMLNLAIKPLERKGPPASHGTKALHHIWYVEKKVMTGFDTGWVIGSESFKVRNAVVPKRFYIGRTY
jgi:hypothetical protein